MNFGAHARPLAGLLDAEAITSLGETAAETALLLRAGVGNVQAGDFIDGAGHRVMLCASPALPSDMAGPQRLLALAAHCLSVLHERAAARAPSRREGRPPVILLGLPERFAQGQLALQLNEVGRNFLRELRARLPAAWAEADIESFPYGRAAGALAMQRALRYVDGEREVLWGGVDTLVDWDVLEALERADRLVTAENIDGIRPGEAAAFVSLGPPSHGDVALLGLGVGREPCPVGAESPCMSEGLSVALDSAVAALRAAQARCSLWWLDASQETYATQEVQRVVARFGDVLGTDSELQMPLKDLGDVGAAAMPLLAVLAREWWRQGVARDDIAVLTGCSDSGGRGAFLLASRMPSRQAGADGVVQPNGAALELAS
jgi:3-oxoacyl-[acyl-carrier-protein] synthase I